MDAAHVHLMLNHVPVLGAVFGLLVLGYGLARPSHEVIRTGFWTLVVVGLASVVVYLTGEPAEELVEGLPTFSHDVLERHEAAALWATVGAGLVGAVALFGLVRSRTRELSRTFAAGVLALTLGLTGLMGWTANLGGQVTHAEIRPEGTAQVDGGAAAEDEDTEDGGEHDDR